MPAPKPPPPPRPPASPATWHAQINQNLPAPRTTDISRKRHLHAMLKILTSIILIALGIAGVSYLYTTWHDDPAALKAPARTQPLRNITLQNPGGVLDHPWLLRALALPKNPDMAEIDLPALRARLLANPQIRNATLTRRYPDTLLVTLEERTPVARLLVQRSPALPPDELLAALDGTLYHGANYNPATLAALPYLADVPLRPATPNATTPLPLGAGPGVRVPQQTAYAPVEGMDTISDLIATARSATPDRYARWRSISLKHYADDRLLIVNNADNSQYIFAYPDTSRGTYRTQLARLDYILDTLAATPGHAPLRTVDLSVGLTPGGVQVPVTFFPAPGAPGAAATSTTITIRHR